MPTSKHRTLWSAATAIGLTAAIIAALGADHAEAPGTIMDPPADIADVYAFHDLAADRLTVVFTFAGLKLPVANQQGTYDPDVLYTLNFDTNADEVSDQTVDIRFGQNPDGVSGIRVENLPGASGVITGPVERVLSSDNNVKVYAGLRDDPFFFDLEGFKATRTSHNLSFVNTRDTFAGTNITAVVLQTRLSAVSSTPFAMWVTTGRLTAPITIN